MLPYNHRHKVNLSVSDNNAIAIECEEPCSVGPWDRLFAKGFASTGWPNGRKRSHAGKLFCHMTNFVASHFGCHKGGGLVPSQYLCIEYAQDQVDLLNPTSRDVQLGAIIDQCSGASAKKVIANGGLIL